MGGPLHVECGACTEKTSPTGVKETDSSHTLHGRLHATHAPNFIRLGSRDRLHSAVALAPRRAGMAPAAAGRQSLAR